jgi:hypothetical protein
MMVSLVNYVPDYTVINREDIFVDRFLYDWNYVSVNVLSLIFEGFVDVQLFLFQKSVYDSNYIALII